MWHGFLDESRRGTTYLVVAVVVRPRDVWTVRDSDDVRARQLCLSAAATWLQELGVSRLAIESCAHQDVRDRQTLASVLEKEDEPFTYEHLRPAEDPLLWASDGLAWCFGAGGDWRQRVQPMLDAVVKLDQCPESAKPGNRPSGR